MLLISDAQGLFLSLAELVLLFQPSAHLLPVGDIFMRGHPAAVRHRVDCVGNGPAIGEFVHGRGWNDGIFDTLLDIVVGLRKDLESQIQPVLDQVADGSSRPYLLG
jgi:hypothetical protein